jgi:hypothetical protein
VGGGTKFEFLRIFFGFFGAVMIKMASFSIEVIKFKFKQDTWMNQMAPHQNQPTPPTVIVTAIGIDSASSNWGGTAHPGRSLPIQAREPANSVPAAATDHALAATDNSNSN